MLDARSLLKLLLKPAGAGLYLVSTGKAEQLALQQSLYRVSSAEAVQREFEQRIDEIALARGVLLGIPSDVGAGFRRGANLGPQSIRQALLRSQPSFSQECQARKVVDLGDVFVVPQLLHDSMLSQSQLLAARQALYPQHVELDLPVSPLSIAERAFELIFELNPGVKPFMLGGDHSVTWPVISALHASRTKQNRRPLGIVQSDAHTDLLETRLGIRYCFATWSFHANALIGAQGRMTQLGIRASGRDQSHWESTTHVKQFWAKDILKNPDAALDEVLSHVDSTKVDGVYFSNDIDGTDSAFADATGTPEPNGLHPDWLCAAIERLGERVGLVGGDVTEVAPSLSTTPDSAKRTTELAARYLRHTVLAALPS
jgi:arginase family enzyme